MTTRNDTIQTLLAGRLSKLALDEGVVLIQLPQVEPTAIEPKIAADKGYFCYPPQALFYLAATLRTIGVPCRLIDLNYLALSEAVNQNCDPDRVWQEAIDRALAEFRQPAVGISCMFDSIFPQLARVCRYIRTRHPSLCIMVGGVAATADPEKVLKAELADLVIGHEGEGPLIALYDFYRLQTDKTPPNLSFVSTEGNICHTFRKLGGYVDLDIRREFKKLPPTFYHQAGSLNNFSRMRGIDVPYATISSRRGCRGHCTFCAVRNFHGKGVRKRPCSSVVDEMVALHDQYEIRHFDWLDDDLLYDHDDALLLFQEIRRRLPGITWGAHNGLIAGSVTPAVLTAMEESGCLGFGVGLESGNPETLKTIRKPTTINTFLDFARLTKNHPGLIYLVNFIIGLPLEPFGQMIDSFRLSLQAELDWTNYFTYQPLKNTDAYLAYTGLQTSWEDEDLANHSTTMNFNPLRANSFSAIRDDEFNTGLAVFDLDPQETPGPEQCKEIWFTFTSITNFIRMPALTTDSEARVRNGIRWLIALGNAYSTNPAMDCVVYFLQKRLNELSTQKLATLRSRALTKFQDSPFWQWRDEQFHFSDLLEGKIPDLDLQLAQYDATCAIR